VELAVIVVPAARVLTVLEACGRKGVGAAIVISAGFKETGEAGRERELALVECARRHGIRLVGPNCLGVLNTEAAVCLDATFAPAYPPAGPVAFSSQSGALGLAILEQAADLNLGISQFISVGNKADVSSNDLLEFWENDPGTRVVLLYLESFGNPRRFTQIARRVGRKKPIIAVKSGRTRAGARAAASHTGSLAGADAAVSALLLQSGISRTDTIEQLFDVALLMASQPVPRGPRIGIVTNAGGPGIMASDACESHGLMVPALDPATVEALKAYLPAEASTRNPVDMIASATPQSYEQTVRRMLLDPNVDALLAIYVPPIVTHPLEVAQAIVRGVTAATSELQAQGAPPKPVASCFMGSRGVLEGLRFLKQGHIPSYPFPESATIALARAVGYGRWLGEPEGATVRFPDCHPERAAVALAAGPGPAPRWLDPGQVREVLEAYGLALPESRVASYAAEAAAFADEIGYPVALKLASATLTHKTEVGGVILDLRGPDEVRRAFEDMQARLESIGRRREMSGALVQRMIRGGVEVVVGVSLDPTFGPLMMFGLGGVQVELLHDVVLRIHPLTDRDAFHMVRDVRGFRLLEGYRGAPPGDIAALEQALLRVSQLVADHPQLVEMDLNPIRVMAPGHGCVILDARIAVR
jgi:acyl-CoA synthetase (NDP forming)